MRKLVLCEKPSVARDVARALRVPTSGDGTFASEDFVITFCIGHLIELEEPAAYSPAWRRWSLDSLPILPEHFRLRPIKQTAKQWKVVRELLARRDFAAVVNACDAGREGELIFRLCYELSGSRLPVERLWISSLTPQAITRGFSELRPGREYEPLGAAARCRAEADWLVGMNATRAVTLWRGGKTLLSLGRVQTPTLSMLVNREREIERFVPRDYFEIEASLATDEKAAPFSARFEYAGKRRFAAAQVADTVADRDRRAPLPMVESVEEKPVREPPPLLFDLTSLQRTANRRFGWSAQHTLSLAQALYERHKLITYPRTDSRYLSQDLIPQLGKTFAALAENPAYAAFCEPLCDGKAKAPRRIFQDHKVTDHHAIIPTAFAHTADRLAGLSGPERQLLDLIARRFIGAFFPDAEFRETKAVICVDAAEQAPATPPKKTDEYLEAAPPVPDRYIARGRVRAFAGWQEVAGFDETKKERGASDDADDSDDEKTQALPPLAVKMRLRSKFAVVAKKTRPPPRYTEASLLSAMEGAGKQLTDESLRQAMKDHGLGTPATRAAIIETLLDRGYVERRAKLLVPTALGLDLIGSLPVPGLRSAELTGQWEARLSHLARGEGAAAAFMSDIAAYVRELVGAVRAAPVPAALAAPPPKAAASEEKPRRRRSVRANSPGEAPAKKPAPRRRAKAAAEPRAPKKPRAIRSEATSSRKKTAPPPIEKLPELPSLREAAPPAISAATTPPPGTPVRPEIRCPRCHEAPLIWGRRAWGCANFRTCSFTVPYELSGRRLGEADLRALVSSQERKEPRNATRRS